MPIRASFRAAGRPGGAFGIRQLQSSRDYEVLVADATADAPGVRAVCAVKAAEVIGAAGRNLLVQPTSDGDTLLSRGHVMASLDVLPVKVFRRRQVQRNSRIPVALAVANDPGAKRWEYGTRRRIPMTRFMRNAASAKAGRGWVFRARGRAKGE
jgi:hypothetical protein